MPFLWNSGMFTIDNVMGAHATGGDESGRLGNVAYTEITTSGVTLTTGQLLNGVVRIFGSTSAFTLVLPTASVIVAAWLRERPNLKVNDAFHFGVINDNTSSGALTITVSSGNTMSTNTLAIAGRKAWTATVTNISSPAVTFADT